MNIEGYAFKRNKSERVEEIRNRLEEIEHLSDYIMVEETPDYKKTNIEGTIDKSSEEAMKLTERDIFIIVTDGFLPFGGYLIKEGNTFYGNIYND